jgi:hypothetical protein
MGCTTWGLNPSRGKRYFCSPKCSEQHWCPPSLLLTEYHASFSGIKQPGCEVDQIQVMSKFRISEAIPLFPILSFMAWTGALHHFYLDDTHL